MNKIYILAILFIIIATPLFAQYSNMTDTIFDLNEVTVTAKKKQIQEMGKLNVPLKFLPVTVNALPSEMLEERGIINLQDATKFLPGTRMRTTYGAY
ncbi:MAG: Plug domain-containing protein [Odoribacter sp.]|nr:Plug domain-containing protein [Odoribacter sp.]